MKILELAPYVFVDGHKYGSKNKSGLAFMTRSVCDMLASENDVHVITQSIFTPSQKVNGWTFVKRNIATILLHFKFRYFKLAVRMIRRENQVSRHKLLLYCLSAGQVEDYIKEWKPDVVHIHTISTYSLPYIVAVAKSKASVISTLHGLVSYNDIVPASPFSKRMERIFLDIYMHNQYPLTFISSGMKDKVQKSFGIAGNNITVIPNCFRNVDIPDSKQKNDGILRLICVGSIYPLKNQIQVIRVLPGVRKRMNSAKDVILDIYGEGVSREEWEQYCVQNNIKGVTFHGRKSQDTVFKAVAQADLLVFPSIEEGFGIPIVEAYNCGTPVVTFEDLDASRDIYNENCCLFAASRSDQDLENAIVEALSKRWDKDKIASFSNKFTVGAISHQYNDVLKIKSKIIDAQIINKMMMNICS